MRPVRPLVPAAESGEQMSASPASRRSYIGRHRRPVPIRGLAAFLARTRSRRSVVGVLRLILVLAAGRS
jgi:hypothetical protein